MRLKIHGRATLFFGVILLLFFQALTTWIESVYKVGLTKLSMGPEALGLLFVLSPLLVLLWPDRGDRMLLWVLVVVFLAARSFLPIVGVRAGILVGGVAVGCFLVLLCMVLSQRFRFLQGDAGVALGLALMISLALRSWGSSLDPSLERSGALLGWLMAGFAGGLFWNLIHETEVQPPTAVSTRVSGTVGPVLSLFASFSIVYLVLSSPAVVEAWMGFDNSLGTVLGVASLGCATVLLARGWHVSRSWLLAWNILFGMAIVGGMLKLRVQLPSTATSSAVVVTPQDPAARLLLNFMFLLSPVVLANVQAACRHLAGAAEARRLAVPVFLGMTLVVGVTLMSIFTNVWGYVGPVSAVFRNQFHVPYVVITLAMVLVLILPGWHVACSASEGKNQAGVVTGLTAALVIIALVAEVWSFKIETGPGGTPRRLTIMTYNIQQGADLAGNRSWEKQLALIKRINPDIIGLQESDTARPSNGNVSAVNYFSRKLGYHAYYGPNTVSGTYGTAILSRFPLRNARTFFTFSDSDEVGTAVAEFELDGKTVAFFSSHPDGEIPKNCHAEELIRQASRYDCAIAVGDYNATPEEEPYRAITARFQDSWAVRHPDGVGPLHPEFRPQGAIRPHGSSGRITASTSGDVIAMPHRIDHIFLSGRFRVIESYYLPAPDSQTDHPVHWAVVALD